MSKYTTSQTKNAALPHAYDELNLVKLLTQLQFAPQDAARYAPQYIALGLDSQTIWELIVQDENELTKWEEQYVDIFFEAEFFRAYVELCVAIKRKRRISKLHEKMRDEKHEKMRGYEQLARRLTSCALRAIFPPHIKQS